MEKYILQVAGACTTDASYLFVKVKGQEHVAILEADDRRLGGDYLHGTGCDGSGGHARDAFIMF